jgi:hypothetical protein
MFSDVGEWDGRFRENVARSPPEPASLQAGGISGASERSPRDRVSYAGGSETRPKDVYVNFIIKL